MNPVFLVIFHRSNDIIKLEIVYYVVVSSRLSFNGRLTDISSLFRPFIQREILSRARNRIDGTHQSTTQQCEIS